MKTSAIPVTWQMVRCRVVRRSVRLSQSCTLIKSLDGMRSDIVAGTRLWPQATFKVTIYKPGFSRKEEFGKNNASRIFMAKLESGSQQLSNDLSNGTIADPVFSSLLYVLATSPYIVELFWPTLCSVEFLHDNCYWLFSICLSDKSAPTNLHECCAETLVLCCRRHGLSSLQFWRRWACFQGWL